MTYQEKKDLEMLNSRIGSILLDRQDDVIRLANKVDNAELQLAADAAASYMQEAYDILNDCIRGILLENAEMKTVTAKEEPERDIQIEVISEECGDGRAPSCSDDYGMGY